MTRQAKTRRDHTSIAKPTLRVISLKDLVHVNGAGCSSKFGCCYFENKKKEEEKTDNKDKDSNNNKIKLNKEDRKVIPTKSTRTDK